MTGISKNEVEADEVEEYLRLLTTAQTKLACLEEVTERFLAIRPRKASGLDGVSSAAL